MPLLPSRINLPHVTPGWIKDGSPYFITICTEVRRTNQLCLPVIGPALMTAALHHHEAQRWWLKLFLLMPDHLHFLAAVPKGESLANVIRMWKSYQTKTLAIEWQGGFFDHQLRSDESEQEKTDYIRNNPVRAGLARESRRLAIRVAKNASTRQGKSSG